MIVKGEPANAKRVAKTGGRVGAWSLQQYFEWSKARLLVRPCFIDARVRPYFIDAQR